MTLPNETIKQIKQHLKEGKLSNRKIAKQLGISNIIIGNVFHVILLFFIG